MAHSGWFISAWELATIYGDEEEIFAMKEISIPDGNEKQMVSVANEVEAMLKLSDN